MVAIPNTTKSPAITCITLSPLSVEFILYLFKIVISRATTPTNIKDNPKPKCSIKGGISAWSNVKTKIVIDTAKIKQMIIIIVNIIFNILYELLSTKLALVERFLVLLSSIYINLVISLIR